MKPVQHVRDHAWIEILGIGARRPRGGSIMPDVTRLPRQSCERIKRFHSKRYLWMPAHTIDSPDRPSRIEGLFEMEENESEKDRHLIFPGRYY